MMQGLKAAPWFWEMSRRGALAIDDCKKCMKTTTKQQRQSLGCGYEPRTNRVHLAVWQPPMSNGKVGYTGEPLTTCAGFTVNLPEVHEVALARMHWSKGNLPMSEQTEEMSHALVVLDAAYSQLQSWLMTPEKDGGGGR